jgi:HEAT repeat protein
VGKKRTLLIVTACGGLAIVLALLLAHDDEPRYKGRSLSKWLEVSSEDPDVVREAQQAIRAIGTNALPYLLKWIQEQPPPWHRLARKKLPEFLSDSAPVRFLIDGLGHERVAQTIAAFTILGTNAAPAIPDLVALTKGTNLFTVVRAVAALSCIGSPAFPHVAAALANTNQPARSYIAQYLRLMARDVGTNACVPPLQAALQDPDPAVRTAASRALSLLAPAILTNAPSAQSQISVH